MRWRIRLERGLAKPSRFAGLVCFHEGVDGFLSALGADLQVITIVGERLAAPLAPFDSRCLHLRDFFEQ